MMIRTAPRFARLAWPSLVAAALLHASPAAAQIWKCDGPNGVVEYSNSPASTQPGRNCKPVDIGPITTIPAPKLPPKAAPAPGAAAGAAPSAGAAPAPSSASPAGFPRVDTATQKARDGDRRRILEDELKKEEAKLAELKKEYNSGEPERIGGERNYQKYLDRVERLKEDIARSESNLNAIRRELAAIPN